jgi:hypothetical protein
VSSFSSLDHVDNLDKTSFEIARALKRNGALLLIMEINHAPTSTEPQTISEDLIDHLSPDFSPSTVKVIAIRNDHDIYGSLRNNESYNSKLKKQLGILAARMRRKASLS